MSRAQSKLLSVKAAKGDANSVSQEYGLGGGLQQQQRRWYANVSKRTLPQPHGLKIVFFNKQEAVKIVPHTSSPITASSLPFWAECNAIFDLKVELAPASVAPHRVQLQSAFTTDADMGGKRCCWTHIGHNPCGIFLRYPLPSPMVHQRVSSTPHAISFVVQVFKSTPFSVVVSALDFESHDLGWVWLLPCNYLLVPLGKVLQWDTATALGWMSILALTCLDCGDGSNCSKVGVSFPAGGGGLQDKYCQLPLKPDC